jgi:hypothetical protein
MTCSPGRITTGCEDGRDEGDKEEEEEEGRWIGEEEVFSKISMGIGGWRRSDSDMIFCKRGSLDGGWVGF